MKIDNLKKEIKTIAIRLGTIAGIALILMAGAFYFSESTNDELQDLEKKKNSIISTQSSQKAKYEKAISNLEKFLKIRKNDLPSETDYKQSYVRLKPLIETMETLKKNYFFKKLDFSMGEIKENKDYNSGNFKVYESRVTIDFQGGPEHFIYSFLDDVNILLPGYIMVQSFEMKTNSIIQPFLVEKFLKDDSYYFTSGKVEFMWITKQNLN